MVAATSRDGQKQCDMPAPYCWTKKCTEMGVLERHFSDPNSMRDEKILFKFNHLESLPKVTNRV